MGTPMFARNAHMRPPGRCLGRWKTRVAVMRANLKGVVCCIAVAPSMGSGEVGLGFSAILEGLETCLARLDKAKSLLPLRTCD
jgi:hypothetical protein